MKFLSTILFLFVFTFSSVAQSCIIKISGHIEDADTKEKLPAASVIILENGRQITTDAKGDFVFTGLCPGEYTLLITHISCSDVQKKIIVTKDFHLDIMMPHYRTVLGNVVVESQMGIANSGFKKELSGRKLEETRGLSLAEALSKINGVTMLQSGSTISKPVIHGLHGNRILTMNNGVRQEGQQWGNEHAPEIDPFIADKLVVIKGVDALRYGSDAIAGVILVEPKQLKNKVGRTAEINTAYFTNNRQYVVSAMFEEQLKKQPAFRYRVQGTYKRGANATTPNYRLNNTGSEERNFSITAGWKKEKFSSELFYSHFATKLGIFTGSHIGNITDLQNAIAASQPDDVFLGQNTYKIQRPSQSVTHNLIKSKTIFNKGEHRFTLLLAGQFNNREEYDIVRNSNNKRPQQDLSLITISEDIIWERPKKNNFSGMAGASMMQQDNSYSGRYFIPNYFSYTFGGFYIEKWSKHKWEVQAGLRYDNKSINTTRLRFNNDTINYDFNFSTLGSSANIAYKPTDNWKLNTTISLATRAPYVNELLSDGIHNVTGTYERGDINLVPERSVNISTGVNFQHPDKNFKVDLLIYSNNINNFIYQQPMPDDPVLTIAGAFPLLKYKQINAVLRGADLSINVKPFPNMEWASKFSYLTARNKSLNDWLILMPANRFSNEVIYQFNDRKKVSDSYISAEMVNVLRQKNVPSDINGKQDYEVPPPAYKLLSLNAASTFSIHGTPVTIALGVRNLLNTVYRDYLNIQRYFTDEMGRNISLKLKIQI